MAGGSDSDMGPADNQKGKRAHREGDSRSRSRGDAYDRNTNTILDAIASLRNDANRRMDKVEDNLKEIATLKGKIEREQEKRLQFVTELTQERAERLRPRARAEQRRPLGLHRHHRDEGAAEAERAPP